MGAGLSSSLEKGGANLQDRLCGVEAGGRVSAALPDIPTQQRQQLTGDAFV